MRISLIAAVALNNVIGSDGGIPWRLKNDMRHFKAITLDKPVIMGRKTFESMGSKPLKDRTNIVMTSTVEHITVHDGTLIYVPDIEAAQIVANQAIKPEAFDNPEIIFIGGERVYKEALPYCNRIYLTTVHCNPTGDTKFPMEDIDWKQWREQNRERFNADVDHDYIYDIATFQRAGKIPKQFLRTSGGS